MSKAILSTIIVLLVGWRSIAADFKIISEGNKHGLADKNGKIVIPIIYDNLGWSNGKTDLIGEVLGYLEDGKWGLISTKNRRISKAVYIDLLPAQDEFLIASTKGTYSDASLFGILDTNGKARLGFQYHSLEPQGNFLVAGQKKNGVVKWGVLNYEEQEIIPLNYEGVKVQHLNFVVKQNGSSAIFDFAGNQLSEFNYDKIGELGSYSLLYDELGKQGLADMLGNIITQPKFKSIRMNNDSSATLTEFPKWELILPENGTVKEYFYDEIVPVSHGIYSVTTNGRQAIINSEEEYLLNGNDWEITVPDDEFVIVKQDNKYGVLKEGGLTVLSLQYDSIYYSGKHFYALTKEEEKYRWQIFSPFGNLISSSYYDAVFPMSESVMATKKNGYWGYIDFSGHTVIEYKYDFAWPFKEGRAKVDYLGNQGVINTAGEWVVYPNHSEVTIVNRDLFIDNTGKRLDLLDALERTVYQTYNQLLPHSYGLLEVSSAGKLGLVDHQGVSKIPPIYDHISELSDNKVYILKKDGYHTIMAKDGRIILDRTNEFEKIGNLSEGFLSIIKDNRHGFIDLDGNLRIANRYDMVKDFKEGMAAIQLVGHWGFIDRLERLRIQPLYDEVEDFIRGISVVSKKDWYGIIDMQGNEILEIAYDSVFRNQLNSFIVVKSGKYGLANFKGELLVPPKYELLIENSNGYLIVKQRGKYGVIKKNGINVIPPIYKNILHDDINGYYLASRFSEEKVISIR